MARTEYRSHYLLEHWKVYTAVIGLVWAAVLLKNENWNHVLKQLLVGTMVHYTIFVIWILLKHWFDFFFYNWNDLPANMMKVFWRKPTQFRDKIWLEELLSFL